MINFKKLRQMIKGNANIVSKKLVNAVLCDINKRGEGEVEHI